MVLSDLAEVATTFTPDQVRTVTCATCSTPTEADMLAKLGYLCPRCLARICVMCGCTDFHACEGGCWWDRPGICSSHAAELAAQVERVFGDDSSAPNFIYGDQ